MHPQPTRPEKTTSATPRGCDRVARRASKRSASCSPASRTRVPALAHSSEVSSATRTGSERPGNFYLEVRTDYRGRGSSLPLLGRPAILADEEPADETDLVDEEQPEPHAQHSRREGQRTMKKDEAPCREGKGHGDGDGDEHHADDGADPEDDQVTDGGERLPDAREHEQGHGGRAGQPVDHAHHERAEDLVEAEPAEADIEAGQRGVVVSMAMIARSRRMRVGMHVVSMRMRRRPERAEHAQRAEQYQHQRHRQLHGQSHTWRDDGAEDDDGEPGQHDGHRVADTPESAYEGGAPEPSLAAHDGGHGDYVIRVGGVAHPEDEPQERDGEEVGQGRALDDSVAAQLLDLVDRVAGFLQDLVGMLAEGGRLAIDARAAVVETESRPDQPQGTVARVHTLEDVAVLELRVVHDLVHFPDG